MYEKNQRIYRDYTEFEIVRRDLEKSGAQVASFCRTTEDGGLSMLIRWNTADEVKKGREMEAALRERKEKAYRAEREKPDWLKAYFLGVEMGPITLITEGQKFALVKEAGHTAYLNRGRSVYSPVTHFIVDKNGSYRHDRYIKRFEGKTSKSQLNDIKAQLATMEAQND